MRDRQYEQSSETRDSKIKMVKEMKATEFNNPQRILSYKENMFNSEQNSFLF